MTIDERLAALEERVSALEGKSDLAPSTGGLIRYEGESNLHGRVTWEIQYTPDAILRLPLQNSVDVLAALGHPVRQGIVRHLLNGPADAADLQAAVGLSSPGQLYHHLKSLTAARVVEQQGRGDYRISGPHVVPILTILLASSDVAGDLGV
ncbi:ArsR/SmtB family transcription factor [Actinomycetes bacterium M1A6_2h]